MPNLYYRLSEPSDVRDLGNQMVAWVAAGNPKAGLWAELPPQPTPSHVWLNGAWVAPAQNTPESVTARQIRLWLIGHGISLASVDAAIDAIPDAATRESVRVEWEYAPWVERSHPMLIPLATALGLSAQDVDAAFVEAAQL